MKDKDRKMQILKQIQEGHYESGVSIYGNCGTVERYIDLRKRLENELLVPHDLEKFAEFIEFLRHLDRLLADGEIRGVPRRDEKGNLTALMEIEITSKGERVIDMR